MHMEAMRGLGAAVGDGKGDDTPAETDLEMMLLVLMTWELMSN